MNIFGAFLTALSKVFIRKNKRQFMPFIFFVIYVDKICSL